MPKGFVEGMKTEGLIFIRPGIGGMNSSSKSVRQVANVATLPGIVGKSLAMPDIHTGYGFPIGGVAAFDTEEGVISPGGVGYDINCLSPETKILTEHGYWTKIEQFSEEYNGTRLKVFNLEEMHNDASEVLACKQKEYKK